MLASDGVSTGSASGLARIVPFPPICVRAIRARKLTVDRPSDIQQQMLGTGGHTAKSSRTASTRVGGLSGACKRNLFVALPSDPVLPGLRTSVMPDSYTTISAQPQHVVYGPCYYYVSFHISLSANIVFCAIISYPLLSQEQ